ncbi:hypothetical protein GCM10019059_42920 [Camelimonas fluminis]|uniref:Integral membrane protein n=1 Tax=Camelimonas fluminis TaxID=1576911 RepID=A0ABV7UPV4_9HYPH|nr:hypothetical protein [Camelimonas fluminis]GHE79934.1 hypothetical protein GCM10019059_42920 [Camelimonas fluminis]
MIWYVLLTTAIGLTGAIARQGWIVLALAGMALLPVGVIGLMLAGDNGWTASGKTFVGLVVMQLVYVLAGWAFSSRRSRTHSIAEHDKPPL